ncbi:hypothetical protein [Methylobacterium nigriterrae]|uniref:hypothetical protein n=1 Tax=Methylobacterium nigriterrae TaxID=3127512 RepID=UPI0030140813
MLFAARYYDRNDLGGLALAIGFVALVQPVLTLRYEIAVVLAARDRSARSILCGLLAIACFGYSGLVFLVFALPSLLANVVPGHVVVEVRVPVLLHVAALTLNVACSAWLQRKKRFAVIAWTQVGGSVITAVWVVTAALVGSPSLGALVWGNTAGLLVATGIVLAGCAASGLFRGGRLGKVRRVIALLRQYRVYPLYSLPLTLSSQVSDRARLIYITSAFSLSLLGGVFSVRQIFLGAVFVVTGSMSQVVFPHLCQGSGLAASRRMLLALTAGVATMAGIALGFVSGYPREITLLLLGERWLDIAPLVPWIAARCAFLAIAGWQGRLLDVAGRQRADAVLQLAGDVALVSVLAVLFVVSVSPTAAIAIISITEMAHSVLWLVLAYRVTRLGMRYACAAFLVLLLATAVMWTIAVLSEGMLGSRVGLPFCAAIVGASAAFILTLTAKSIGRADASLRLPKHRARAA